MIEGLDRLEVITLFVDDLAAATAFYRDVLGLALVHSDDNSAVVELANVMVNLLRATEARGAGGGRDAGPRMLFTIRVTDVDATCAELERHGVSLLNGPVDRPWGRRTAAFADPAGNVWEVAQLLPDAD